jgi:hypothetical protein
VVNIGAVKDVVLLPIKGGSITLSDLNSSSSSMEHPFLYVCFTVLFPSHMVILLFIIVILEKFPLCIVFVPKECVGVM